MARKFFCNNSQLFFIFLFVTFVTLIFSLTFFVADSWVKLVLYRIILSLRL